MNPRLAFGLPDVTEQLSLFRLWLCENFILRVSRREKSFIFKTLFKHSVPSIVLRCLSALSNIASVSLTFEFNPIQISQGASVLPWEVSA